MKFSMENPGLGSWLSPLLYKPFPHSALFSFSFLLGCNGNSKVKSLFSLEGLGWERWLQGGFHVSLLNYEPAVVNTSRCDAILESH